MEEGKGTSDNKEIVAKPFKITDLTRNTRKGVVATTLQDLTSKVAKKLDLDGKLKLVLESDGTEIDDDEYFATLEPDTSLMVLTNYQKWRPHGPLSSLSQDQVDDSNEGRELVGLVDQLKHDITQVSLFSGPQLELLSDMDPDSFADINFPDKVFLEQLKEASGRYLSEKRQAQEAMELLELYRQHENSLNKTD